MLLWSKRVLEMHFQRTGDLYFKKFYFDTHHGENLNEKVDEANMANCYSEDELHSIKTMLIIMCLSQPLKLKNRWHFLKGITLNTVFMTRYIHNVLRFFIALQPFFCIYFFKRETKWRRFWVQRIQFKWFLLKLKSIITFLARGLFFHFFNAHIHNVFLTWPNVV